MKFRIWLYKKAKKMLREAHLRKHGNDIKCSRCNEWFSVSGVEYNHKFRQRPDDVYVVECGKCGHESFWSYSIAPVPVQVCRNGTPN